MIENTGEDETARLNTSTGVDIISADTAPSNDDDDIEGKEFVIFSRHLVFLTIIVLNLCIAYNHIL